MGAQRLEHLRVHAQDIIPYGTDGGIAKLSCNGVSLTRNGSWLLPIWREIGGGQPCQSVPKSVKALHGVAGVLLSDDQVCLHLAAFQNSCICQFAHSLPVLAGALVLSVWICLRWLQRHVCWRQGACADCRREIKMLKALC